MAKQNVSTPRFYIDHLQYIRAIGKGFPADGEDIFNLNPSSFLANKPLNAETNWWDFGIAFDDGIADNVNYGRLNYVAILGHNLGTCMEGELNLGFRDNVGFSGQADYYVSNYNPVGVVNFDAYTSVPLDGFSIATFDDIDFNGINLWFSLTNTVAENKIGSLSLGGYYEMPHSPELSLTLSHEYKGVTKQTTMGGSTLTNINYYKPPKWGDKEAWQLGGIPRKYSGRRVWDLSFNYLNDEDLEPAQYNMDESTTQNTWRDNWFSNILYYTMGGALPFIFQPNKDAIYDWNEGTGQVTNIPEFAICRFDMDTFSREQVANSVYNIKVKIKESW